MQQKQTTPSIQLHNLHNISPRDSVGWTSGTQVHLLVVALHVYSSATTLRRPSIMKCL
ncbi:hypothetical protein DSUL_20063 [Desulfovibrionales bacterium]